MPTPRRRGKILLLAVLMLLATALLLLMRRDSGVGYLTVQGVVLRQDKDLRGQQPIADVQLQLRAGRSTYSARTNNEGYFSIPLHRVVLPGTRLFLTLAHPQYQQRDVPISVSLRSSRNFLHVLFLRETSSDNRVEAPATASIRMTSLRVRYVENGSTETNIGSISRTFEVANQANIPCKGHQPCSPDGRWKASIGNIQLDAGPGNEFRQIRISCIAGPCPFTRIDSSRDEKNGQILSAHVLNWSDTATFLVEAEVYHVSLSSAVHHLFPVIFGRTVNFTLPANEEGVSLEAEMNGTQMVFPLGPEGDMSWASCLERDSEASDHARVYHCELKQGYAF